MRTFKLFSMAAVALVMAACSNEDSALENPTPAQPGTMHFTATLAAPGSGATTRTTYTEVTEGADAGKINVAWEKGDQILLVNMVTQNGSTISVGTIAADGSASISGDIPAGNTGDQIYAVYPVSIMQAILEGEFDDYKLQQVGTLEYIQDNFDFRAGTGTLSVSGDKATLFDKLQMESMIAIWKLTLQNSSSEALSATKVTIKKGSDVLAATADISATSTVYLAVPINDDGLSNADIIIEATVGSEKYSFSKSGVTLERGKYYQSTVKMKALTYPVALSTVTAGYIGSVVCSDGNVYRAKTAVPTGCTAVGILGKVTTTGHGLIIALKDATSQTWNTINGWTSETTYAGTTLKVLPDDAARGTNLTSYTKLGSTDVSNWAVGQKSDYEAIFTNLDSNHYYSGKTLDNNVNAYITTGVGGDAMSGTYWSATEQDSEKAWFFESYSWDHKVKSDNLSVRPVLGF